MATTIGSVCPKCGITKKSGKLSCCGRGGSWFGNCENAGDMKLGHTWYEGLRSCGVRAQSKTVIDQQLKGAHQGAGDSFIGAEDVNFRAIVAPSESLALTSVPTTGARSIIALARTPPNTSTASATVTIEWKPNTVTVTRSYNDFVDMAMAAPVHALATSQKQPLHIHVYIMFSLGVMEFFQFFDLRTCI